MTGPSLWSVRLDDRLASVTFPSSGRAALPGPRVEDQCPEISPPPFSPPGAPRASTANRPKATRLTLAPRISAVWIPTASASSAPANGAPMPATLTIA